MRALLLSIVVITGVANAQTPTPADAAFKRGRELLKAGKYADACVEFEHSQKLDPALGTEFNIAQCSEQIGKLARALEMYRDLAARDTKEDRKKVVAESIPKLEARVPHLIAKITAPPAGFTLTYEAINSGLPPKPLEANKSIEIDFGEYELVARATGAPEWRQNIRIDTEAKTTTVDVPMGAKPTIPTKVTEPVKPIVKTEPVPDDHHDVDEPPAKSKRKLYGVVAMSVGGAALVTGVVFGAMASSKWSKAKDVCGGTTCTTQADLKKANDLADDARGKAKLSTIFVVVGTVSAATGVVLFVTAPKSESATRISAYPTESGGGLSVSGSF